MIPCCDRQPIYAALIILGVIGIGALGMGLACFGASQSLWGISAPFSQISQINAIIMMSAGGGAGFVLFTAGAVGSVRNCIRKKENKIRELQQQHEEARTNKENEIQRLQQQLEQARTKGGEEFDKLQQLLIEEEWEVVSTSPSGEKPPSRVEQAFEFFDYEQIAEQKYQTVLDEYVRNLGFAYLVTLGSEVEKSLDKDLNNALLISLKKVLLYLTKPEVNGPRISYQSMVRELRAAINSLEYKKISDKKGDDLQPAVLKLRDFVRHLCLIRWKGTHLHNYLKDIVHLTIGKDELTESDLEPYPDKILELNRAVKESALKKSLLALEWQKLRGALGLEDFGMKNIPNVRNIQYFINENNEILPITYARHGTPTALGDDYSSMGIAVRRVAGPLTWLFLGLELESGEEVTVDYQEFLKAMNERKESVLYCNHQRKTPNTVENESTRVQKIEELQKTHSIYVLTQPVEGDLFQHTGEYSKIVSFEDLKQALETEFFDTKPENPKTRAALPLYLQSDPSEKMAYRQVFKKLLDDVHEIFFPDEKEAVGPSICDSALEIDSKLKKEYENQALAIKQRLLKNKGLIGLERVEAPAIDMSVLENLLEDKELVVYVRSQITDLDQLANWVDVDRNKSLDELLIDQVVFKELMVNILGSAAEIEKTENLSQLEQERAEALAKWQSYILLVYVFQKMDLKFRLNGVNGFILSTYTTPCKDFLDRGGNMAFVEDRLIHYMLGEEKDPERMKEALYNLLGPPIHVKKKEAIERRILPGIHVERLLASMNDERREKLANYRFGKDKWRVKGIKIPKLKGQSGMPSVPRLISLEIASVLPPSIEEIEKNKDILTKAIVSIFQKYSGIELGQWEAFNIADSERVYQADGKFDGEKVKNQVERDMQPQQGVQFDVKRKAATTRPNDFGSLRQDLLNHPLVNGNEQVALKVLASFHQGTGGAAIIPITSALGRALGNLMTVAPKVPGKEDGIVRHYLLDLSRDDIISIRYTDSYEVKSPEYGLGLLAGLNASAVIEYHKGEDGLSSEGHVGWSVK
ncbi:MAG: OmpH family outer membrane protein [Chlamydiales bacterium]|nr:OmpH family outer membrane protein [Chlamydiales bacterium]